MVTPEKGKLVSVANSIDDLVHAIAVLNDRMLARDGIESLLQVLAFRVLALRFLRRQWHGLVKKIISLAYKPQSLPDTSGLMMLVIDSDSVESVVTSEMQSANVIDLRIYLLPPRHGSLCLWGNDELLSYEFFGMLYLSIEHPNRRTPVV
jgi:hypothetical protein